MVKDIEYLSSSQMIKVDNLAVSFGLGIEQMMENAGRNLARFVMQKLKPKKAIVIFGKGNNGGGGLVAARHLSIYGVDVQIVSASKNVNKNVRHQLKILGNSRIRPVKSFRAKHKDIVIDALLGYNIKGNPKARYADLINGINFMRKNGMKVVSLDLPSGVNPDNPLRNFKPCIIADYTLTLALPKKGLRTNKNAGSIFLANIGIPNKVYERLGIKTGNYFERDDFVRLGK